MKLYSALKLDPLSKEVISIVGGGGKTSAMFKLASELRGLGKRVLVTTTTAIMMPEESQYDLFLEASDTEYMDRLCGVEPGTITVLVGHFIRADKVKGIDEEAVDKIAETGYFDYIIVEADGSRMKPIKAPRDGEPLIPDSTTKLIGVVGLDALGKRVDEDTVHRVEIFKAVTESADGDMIDSDMVSKLIVHSEGLFKGGERIDKYLILNKADSESIKAEAAKIADKVKGKIGIKSIMIARLKYGEISVW